MTVDTLQSMGSAMPASNVYGIARAPFFALEQTPEVKAFVEVPRRLQECPHRAGPINGYDGLMFYAAAAEHQVGCPRCHHQGDQRSDGLRGKG